MKRAPNPKPYNRDGAKLRRLREALGLTQLGLAKLARVNVADLRRHESGDLRPSAGATARLARALGVEVSELREDDGPGTKNPAG